LIFAYVYQRNGNSRQREDHGDVGAHEAGANNRGVLNVVGLHCPNLP
jgi:hypothetical protein